MDECCEETLEDRNKRFDYNHVAITSNGDKEHERTAMLVQHTEVDLGYIPSLDFDEEGEKFGRWLFHHSTPLFYRALVRGLDCEIDLYAYEYGLAKLTYRFS